MIPAQATSQLPRAWVFAALLLAAGGAAGQSRPAEGEREDLLPAQRRWQELPEEVTHVTFDRGGRAWFEVGRGFPYNRALKADIRRAAALKAPWFTGGRIMLHDSKARVWVLDNGAPRMLGYDPRTGEWLERWPGPDQEKGKALRGQSPHSFGPALENRTAALEARDGRLFFADRDGVHEFDGKNWTYQPMYDLNARHGLYYEESFRGTSPPELLEGADGRVYAWADWGRYGCAGTVGFFVHDGRGWTHKLIQDWRGKDGTGVPPAAPAEGRPRDAVNRIHSLVPLRDGTVFVSTHAWQCQLVPPDPEAAAEAWRKQILADIALLGSGVFAEREAAQQRLGARGAAALPLLKAAMEQQKDTEVSLRLAALAEAAAQAPPGRLVDGWQLSSAGHMGTDGAGRTWLRVGSAIDPRGKRVHKLTLTMSPDGRLAPASEALAAWDPAELFFDPQGRLWVADREHGAARVEGDKSILVTGLAQKNVWRVLGQDRAGRVFLYGARCIWTCRPDLPDTPAAQGATRPGGPPG